MPNETLEVSVRKLEDGIVVEAVGAVDLMTIKALVEPLNGAVKDILEAEYMKRLSVDLRLTSFIDSAGLAVLVAARKQLALTGRSLEVFLTPGQQPERVLRVGRFDTIMALHCSEPG